MEKTPQNNLLLKKKGIEKKKHSGMSDKKQNWKKPVDTWKNSSCAHTYAFARH
jgi:hypothetical protein